jgi:TonB family protein
MKHFLNLLLIICCLAIFSPMSAQGLLSKDNEEIFTVVEDMPIPWLYKTECLDVPSENKNACYQSKVSAYLLDQMTYPYQAVQNKIQGTVVIQFVVDESGKITDANIIQDIGYGCGAEALKQVKSMPNWIPGRQRGVPVKVRYTLPVQFKLK